MIEFFKIAALPRIKRIKKVVLLLEEIEQALVQKKSPELSQSFYLKQLINIVFAELNKTLQSRWTVFFGNRFLETEVECIRIRLINDTRHFLYTITGEIPSEWDLILPSERSSQEKGARTFFPDVYLYAESIRSPFNLGSLFRTADAFGVQKIFLSPDCVSAEHPRAIRSAMGCIDFVPHERKALASVLDSLPSDFPVLGLETGGSDIHTFVFPKKAILLVGSEELGLSSEALRLCTHRLSIRMHGIKASVNVGVAYGIAMQIWTTYLSEQ
ncbi:MAG: TrmH family RNA methyltransferase [Spirochaetaceae bacterium]|nr:TrmH family RNA methyltransferase [Spirochaetaceae bacterium]